GKAMGLSRKCVAKWLSRYASEGEAGLHDRSSRPRSCPRRTSDQLEQRILELRHRERRGPGWVGDQLGVPARTVSRVLARNLVPHLCALDPITGDVIRAAKTTAVRYEREQPGELAHMDVKKIGRIRRRRLASPRPRQRARLRLRPLPGRRPLPAGLLRNPARREGHHLRRLPQPRDRLLRRTWHHPYRTADDRQRLGLPLVPTTGLRHPRHPAKVHQTPLPLAERQGRETQPNPANRVGLPTALHQQRRPNRCPCTLARTLQHSTPPQRTRRKTTHQPPATNLMAGNAPQNLSVLIAGCLTIVVGVSSVMSGPDVWGWYGIGAGLVLVVGVSLDWIVRAQRS